MKPFRAFPLLAIPVGLYNVFSVGSSMSPRPIELSISVLQITMPAGSNVAWTITWGDFLLTLAVVFLFCELVRSVIPGRTAILNHSLSMVLFIACLVEFLLFSQFATSVFFLLMLMTLLDVLAGFIVTVGSARRDVSFSRN